MNVNSSWQITSLFSKKITPLVTHASLESISTTSYPHCSPTSSHKSQPPPKNCHSHGVAMCSQQTKTIHASKQLTTQFRLSTRTSPFHCCKAQFLLVILVEPSFHCDGQMVTSSILVKPFTAESNSHIFDNFIFSTLNLQPVFAESYQGIERTIQAQVTPKTLHVCSISSTIIHELPIIASS